MSTVLTIVLGLLALCTELFLREALALTRWSPDLAQLIILWLAVRGWSVGGFMAAAAVGLLADGFVGSPVGLHMLQAIVLVFLAGLVADRVRFRSLPGRLLLGALGGVVGLLILVLEVRIFLGDVAIGGRVADLLVPRAVVLMLGVPLAFPLLDRLDALVSRRREADLT